MGVERSVLSLLEFDYNDIITSSYKVMKDGEQNSALYRFDGPA